jgi:hypothetical protein
METDASSGAVGRPRPWLLVALALVAGLALVSWLMPGKSAAPAPRASNPRVPAAKKGVETVQPADLDVHLEELKAARPASEAGERNPFRFYVKPPPPPPPAPPVASRGNAPPPPVVDAGPPPPPKIPLKFIGVIEVPGGGKVAALSDCRMTMHGREGEIIAGQYRLVHIGVESVVMEYVDGRGRETIRMSGQECVGK